MIYPKKSTSWPWSYSLDVVGSSNSLLCFRLFDKESEKAVVWNPATKKYRRLPEPLIQLAVLGFEFIQEIKDYKLVSIQKGRDVIKSQVVTGSSKSWKNVENFQLRGVDDHNTIHYLINYLERGGVYIRSCGQEMIHLLLFWHFICSMRSSI